MNRDDWRKVFDIIRRREYIGYLLGILSFIAAYELQDRLEWLALIVIAVAFLGFPFARKYGS